MSKQNKKVPERIIASNKKAFHDYFIESRLEAGLVLEGWEVKSIRAGRVQLKDSYVLLKDGEAWVIGVHISPLLSASSHVSPDPERVRKLLLNRREIEKLFRAKDREGYTIVVTDLHWHKNRVKADIAAAKGKKDHDRRETIKRREWEREKHRVLKRA